MDKWTKWQGIDENAHRLTPKSWHRQILCQEKEEEDAITLDCVDATIQGFEEYTKLSKERQIGAANNSNVKIRTKSKLKNSRK